MPNNRPKDEVLSSKRISLHKTNKLDKKRLWKLKLAKLLINDLKNYGPANLLYMKALSIVIRKPIRVWLPGRCEKLYKIINGTHISKNTTAVDVEYQHRSTGQIGHWTLIGNKDPINVKLHLNGCLFDVIAAQIENNAIDLRNRTIKYLENNINMLIDQINDNVSSSNKNGTKLLIGGARYSGMSPNAAAIILDKSQNVYCDGCKYKGHPRGHAFHRLARGPLDSVDNYSKITKSKKSGFLSRADQNTVAHHALKHRAALHAMEKLNSGTSNEAVTLSARDLQIAGCTMPQMKEWCNGEECSGLLNIEHVQLVLRHHQGKHNDPDADVFVHTFYPKSY